MANDPRTVPETEQWRQKYYQTLDQLDHKERDWQRQEEVLRLCISRLTLAADGSDKTLAQDLKALREALRQDRPSAELEEMMGRLSENILRLDEQRRRGPTRANAPELMAQLLDGIPFPRGMGHKARSIRQRLKQSDPNADLEPLTKEVSALIAETLQWLADESDAGRPTGRGLLSRLFAGRGADASPAAVDEDGEEESPDEMALATEVLRRIVTRVTLPDDVAERFHAAADPAALKAVAGDIALLLHAAPRVVVDQPPHEVLLQLLERLTVPAEFTERVDALKVKLADGIAPGELARNLSAVADVIAEMRARIQDEKAELERFLKQLTENLKELDLNLQGAVATRTESFEEGRQLDARLGAEMQGIEDSMFQAADLDTLKVAIQQRVTTIRSHMEAFRTVEEARQRDAEQRIEQLNTRLNEMEHETSTLRERVRQERISAMIDPLTQIPNRLAYNERLQAEYARWKRYKTPLVYTVWDVDNFKRINDTYGHQAGDKVLRVVAKLLRSQVRETDFIARFGGEEFVVLLPETQLAEAVKVADALRSSVEQCEFHHRKQRVPITISCGLTELREGDTAEEAFARADAALYQAKEQGRNRCIADQ